MEVVIFILVAALIIAGVIYSSIQARKRREALDRLANKLGFRFQASRDHDLPDRFRFLEKLDQGSNRYAFNLLWGELDGERVDVFDYHYETYSTDTKGRRTTNHHYFSFFILMLPRPLPELTIGPEGFLSKFAQSLGYDDIDFESHEFSRQFCVRSQDKKFAYDFCNSSMIEYLLANRDISLEVENHALAIGFSSRLAVGEIEYNLGRLREIRQRLPEYLFTS